MPKHLREHLSLEGPVEAIFREQEKEKNFYNYIIIL